MPGAASMTSVRYLDTTAPKDGTVITMFDPGLITQVLTADKPVVDFANFQWVGTLLRDIRICYAWARDRHQDLRRHDEAQGVPDRHHRQRLQRLRERRDPAQRVQGAGAPDCRLSRQQRAAPGAGARRARGQLRLLDRDAAGVAGQKRINRAAALLGRRGPTTCRRTCPTCSTSRSPEQRPSSTSSTRRANLGGRSSSPSRCRRSGWHLRAALQATLKDEAFLAEAKKQSLLLDPVAGEEAEKIMAQSMRRRPN